jgi:hypothetical protein
MVCKNYQRIKDRRLISRLLGRRLKQSEQVHHHPDGTLILCKDQTQHMQIHREINALEACGHKDWRKCMYCKEYDSPDNLYINGHKAYHRKCHNEYKRLDKLHRAARYAGALGII